MNITLPELSDRIEKVYNLTNPCVLCPRDCKVNRKKGEKGFCKAEYKLKVSRIFPHFGEEPPISGTYGSGTIFFSNCNLRCVYCQNYPFSQQSEGDEISKETLAQKMIWLQNQKCHNINLVTPTHFLPFILESIYQAKKAGLSIPIVYNTSGYEKIEILKLLYGIIDIYLVDMRYANKESSRQYSGAYDYPQINQNAVREIFQQTGDIEINEDNIMQKGLIIRHLILPNSIAGSESIFEFIYENFSNKIPISLMSQYFPYHQAKKCPELDRKITRDEYDKAVHLAEKYNFEYGWFQEFTEEEDKKFAGAYFNN
ncbi:MAG: radical SAM protein [bacterium]